MTSPTFVNPAHLHDPRPNGYSLAAIAPEGTRLAFVSGQGAQDATGALPADFGAQVEAAYDNLAAALEAVGASPEAVVKLTTFVVDHSPDKLAPLTAAVLSRFGDTPPAQTLIGVSALAVPGMLFEVEAVAVVA